MADDRGDRDRRGRRARRDDAIGGEALHDLDDEERAALHAALAEGIAQDDARDTVDADEVLAYLGARAS